ncbi:unnamed protein product [Blumeria hordei]|uniref:Uncharacterized protein n=2 Tax=Blumeria hordei TaxID=2867405 RepID=A0A383V2M8_BLUHO|nr:hypothetical protein BGHDH14_bghG004008000001001 [Blumeria hordei DH14]SZF05782.1 unnamed protein product [Blumeria hordei]
MGIPIFISPDESKPTACLATEKTPIPSRSFVSRHRNRPLSRGDGVASNALGEMRRRRRIEASFQAPEELRELATFNVENMRPGDLPATLNSRAIVTFERERERMRQRSSIINHERRRRLGSEIQVSLIPAAVTESGESNESDETSQHAERLRQTRINYIRRTAERNSASPPALDAVDLQNQLVSSWQGISPEQSRSNSHDHQFILASTYRRQNTNLQSDNSYSSLTHSDSNELQERTRALTQLSIDLDRSRRSTFQAHVAGLSDTDRIRDSSVDPWQRFVARTVPNRQSSIEASTASVQEDQSNSGQFPANITADGTDRIEEFELRLECASDPGTDTESEAEEVQIFDMRTAESLLATTDLYNGRNNESQHQENVDSDDLDGWHRVISRLTERDDIPDEWWASVGLSRTLRPRSES